MNTPFRTELRKATRDELEEARRGVWQGDYQSHRDSVRAIRAVPDDVDVPDDLDLWLTHPDERVVMAALDRWDLAVHTEEPLAQAVLWRANANAQADGVAWTPLLDRLAATDLWPDPRRRPTNPVPHPDEYLEGTAGWLREKASLAEIKALLSAFSSYTALEAIARSAGALDRACVEQLMECGAALRALVSNPALPEGVGGMLVADVARRMAAHGKDAEMAFDWRSQTINRGLAERGYPFTAEEVEEVLEAFSDEAIPEKSRRGIAFEFAKQPNLPGESLARVYQHVADDIGAVRHMMAKAGQDAPLPFYRKVARTTTFSEIRGRIASVERLRADPEVRAALLERGSFKTLSRLWADATPEELSTLLRRMLELAAHRMGPWLAQNPIPADLPLTADDLEPLLTHTNGEIRMHGITALSNLRRPEPKTPGAARKR